MQCVSFRFISSFVISHLAGAVRVGFHSSCFLRSGEMWCSIICNIICSVFRFVSLIIGSVFRFVSNSSFVLSSRCCRVGFHSSRLFRATTNVHNYVHNHNHVDNNNHILVPIAINLFLYDKFVRRNVILLLI